jgi:uncharacterized protein (DUF1697 family)
MTTYLAMLSGINVGGHKTIAMPKLRASFGALGFAKVTTYVQSGNVVFSFDRYRWKRPEPGLTSLNL